MIPSVVLRAWVIITTLLVMRGVIDAAGVAAVFAALAKMYGG